MSRGAEMIRKHNKSLEPIDIHKYMAIVGFVLLAIWIGNSYMEARAYERVTGKHISLWNAM